MSFSSDPGKNEEKVGARVVAYLQIPEKIALIRTILEVSVALAGFASIVVLVRRGPSGRWSKADVDRYFGMVSTESPGPKLQVSVGSCFSR